MFVGWLALGYVLNLGKRLGLERLVTVGGLLVAAVIVWQLIRGRRG
ncbi:MAG: hypothetical protein IAE99_03225 [Rhodothermales bacterium]|nr:hypothetical protein [Rhodothermales bacterium]